MASARGEVRRHLLGRRTRGESTRRLADGSGQVRGSSIISSVRLKRSMRQHKKEITALNRQVKGEWGNLLFSLQSSVFNLVVTIQLSFVK